LPGAVASRAIGGPRIFLQLRDVNALDNRRSAPLDVALEWINNGSSRANALKVRGEKSRKAPRGYPPDDSPQ